MFTEDACLYTETFVFKVVNDTRSLSVDNRGRITTGLEYYFGAFGNNVTLDEIINQASAVYIQAYEAITGAKFVPDLSGDTVLERIRSNLARYF